MEIGKQIIILGLVILIIGISYTYFKQYISWFGNLPGDIKWVGSNYRIYFPIISLLLISMLLNAIYYIVRYLKQ